MANPISPLRKNLGVITAYGYAKKHNYPRSEEEFGQELANGANYAHQAGEHASHADTVKNSVDAAASQVQNDVNRAAASVSEASKTVQQIDTKKVEVDASLVSLGTAIKDANAATRATQGATEVVTRETQKLVEAIQQTDGAADGAVRAAGNANTAALRAENAVAPANAAGKRAEDSVLPANTAAGRAEKATQDANNAATTVEAATKAAGTAKSELDKSMTAAGNAKSVLDQSVATANTAKENIETATATANGVKTELGTLVDSAEETNLNLTKGVENAEKAIAGLDKQTGKVVYYIDLLYRTHVINAANAKEVDDLFAEWWWINWNEGKTNRQDLLERWFGSVLDDGLVHGVKLPLFKTSSSPSGELTNDSVGLVCEPSTAAKAGRDDFAKLPQFWCLEVSAEKRPDGSHEIFAVEHIDSIDKVRDGTHLTWVLQKNTFTKEWADGQYHYFQMQCHPATGFTQWPQGTDRTGRTYAYIGNPKYAAGITQDGRISCGTNLYPANFYSHSSGVSEWRKRGAQYSGASGCLIKWQLAMIWLKYAKKGNSGLIEGCTNYYQTAKAAVSESGVQRVLIAESDRQKFIPGSAVCIGKGDSFWSGDTFCVSRHAKILSIGTANVGGQNYAAVNLDNGGQTFNTTAGTTAIFTQPYWSGYNDEVLGYDGSKTSPTGSREPGLIQKTEFQNGAYMILSDELWQWSQPGGAGTDFHFDCFTCHDQTKVSTGSITADYQKQTDLTLKFPSDTAEGWQYNEDCMIGKDCGVLWPRPSKAAGSGTGMKSGFYVQPRSGGIRAAWCFCFLTFGSDAGLPARDSNNSTTNSDWSGCVGVPGLSG